MRKKGLLLCAVVVVLALVLAHLFTDDFLERQMESSLSSIVGARVEVDDLDLSLISLSMGWKRLQVTDPENTWRNILETGPVQFNLRAEPLLYGRWIIEEIRLEDIRSGTRRETDGKLPTARPAAREPTLIDQTVAALESELERSTGIDLAALNQKVNVDSIIQLLQLQTPAKIDTLSGFVNQAVSRWRTAETELKSLDKKAAQIVAPLGRTNVQALKTLDDIIAALDTLVTVKSQLDSTYKSVISQKQQLQTDWQELRQQIAAVDDWIQEDIKNALSKARLPDFRTENMAAYIFGPELIPRVERILEYANIAYRYGKKLAPTGKVKSPPRFKGQDIRFPDRRKMPAFWLQKALVSGTAEYGGTAMALKGTISNLTTRPEVVGEPFIMKVTGQKSDSRAFQLLTKLDRTGKEAKDQFVVRVSSIPVTNIKLSSQSFLPESIDKALLDADIDLNINAGKIDGRLNFVLNSLKMKFRNANSLSRVEQILQKAFAGVRQASFTLELKGDPSKPRVGLRSNLDRLLAQRFQNVVSDELIHAREELEKEVRKRTSPKVAEFRAFFYEKSQRVDRTLAQLDAAFKQRMNLVEARKKELEKRFEQEKKKQTDKLKQEAEKKLKGILKKIKK